MSERLTATERAPGACYCKRRDCFNLALADGYCGAHLREKREKRTSFRELQAARIAELEAQREELLAALMGMVEWSLANSYPDNSDDLRRARAAIRRAEGGAK